MSETLNEANFTSEGEDLMNCYEENEKRQNGGNWSELPSLPIEKIYSFLSRSDQCRMSLVCRKWSKEYSSPSLWKTVKFYLPERDYSSEIHPEVRFARKYGSMFRHVEIVCKSVRPHLLGVIRKQLKFFFQALTSESQLTSIKFNNMGHYFACLDYFIRQDVFKAIVNLFRSQKNLSVIDFRNSYFSKKEGIDLLKVITETCSNTLKTISLNGYFNLNCSPTEPNESADLSDIFNMFLNIQTVETDYSRVFEDMMRLGPEDCETNTPAILNDGNEKRSSRLSTLKINCQGRTIQICTSRYQSYFRGIPPSSWTALNEICPNLTVNLDLTIEENAQNEIERFIVQAMPIKTLHFIFDDPDSFPKTNISVLLNHLLDCRANDHLEVVNIFWMSTISDLAAAVVPFLQACSKLRIFYLRARHSDNGIEDILKSLLEQRPSCLTSIALRCDSLRNEENEAELIALYKTYYPLLKVIGINLFYLANHGRELSRRRSIT